LLNRFFKAFFDFIGLIFPQLCAACGTNLYYHEKVICSNCLFDLPLTRFADPENNMVAELFWGRVPVKYCTSYFYYMKDSKYQNIIHGLKYQGKQNIGLEFGKIFGSEIAKTALSSADVIVPVPLHPRKLRKRGFNQSEIIARGMAEGMGKKIMPGALERIRYTDTQTNRSRYERWKNVEGIFRVRKPQLLAGKHVLLVDDVVTAGSTIEACASEILKLQGTTVSVATLAVAKYPM
jgi:ComF family protein